MSFDNYILDTEIYETILSNIEEIVKSIKNPEEKKPILKKSLYEIKTCKALQTSND